MNRLSEIIGEDEIQEIRQKGEEFKNIGFWFGYKALDIYARIEANRDQMMLKFTETGQHRLALERLLPLTLHDAIIFIAETAGLSIRTVQRYVTLASYYPPEVVDEFEILPLSHFEFARQFPQHSRSILDASLRMADENAGRPVPLSRLQALFRSVESVPAVLEELNDLGVVDSVVALDDCYGAVSDHSQTDEPPIESPVVNHFLRKIGVVHRYIKRAIMAWSIEDQDRAEILDALDHFFALVERVSARRELER